MSALQSRFARSLCLLGVFLSLSAEDCNSGPSFFQQQVQRVELCVSIGDHVDASGTINGPFARTQGVYPVRVGYTVAHGPQQMSDLLVDLEQHPANGYTAAVLDSRVGCAPLVDFGGVSHAIGDLHVASLDADLYNPYYAGGACPDASSCVGRKGFVQYAATVAGDPSTLRVYAAFLERFDAPEPYVQPDGEPAFILGMLRKSRARAAGGDEAVADLEGRRARPVSPRQDGRPSDEGADGAAAI
jgi:hypothetical protein